jgi:hypothetical protein
MQKKVRIFLIAATLIIFIKCINKNEIQSDSIKTIKIDFDNVIEELSIKELFTDIRIVKLETNHEALFDEANKVVTTSDHIYITDGVSITLFTIDGKFKKKFNNQGRGPGEYSGISDFIIDEHNKKIEILNSERQKVLIYDMDFNFIDEYFVKRFAMNFAMLDNGIRLFHCGNDASGNSKNKKMLVFRNGKKSDEFLPIDMNRYRFLHYRRFDFISYYKNSLSFTDAHCNSIYSYNGENFQVKYLIDIGDKSIPEKVYSAKAYNDIAEFTLAALMGSGYAYGIFNYLESENFLFFKYEERIKDRKSQYGKLVPTSVLYCKQTDNSTLFKRIVDDFNFKSKTEINKFISFFSQHNGEITYLIPAYEFIEMYENSELNSKDNRIEGLKDFPATEIYQKTKQDDNPILFIANLR